MRAAVRQFDQALFILVRPAECTANMAKKVALHQRAGVPLSELVRQPLCFTGDIAQDSD